MSSWHSYPSIYNLGHKAIGDLLLGPVNVEEKIDGSQFSFGIFENSEPCGCDTECDCPKELKVRSKGAVMHPDAPPNMFKAAVEHVKSIQHLLHVGWTYRGECLAKPKHNTLVYDRVPHGHVILFDINTGEEEYLGYDAKATEAARLQLEVVPLLYHGVIGNADEFRRFLDAVSVLGGQKIEGVVVKPVGYDLFGRDKKALFGKFVSEAFKEAHSIAWKDSNPTSVDILTKLGQAYGTPARWNKAIQHLREAGEITDSVKDIGKLIVEIQKDTGQECKDDIKQALWRWAWPHVSRMITRQFPQFYKEQLLTLQFERAPGQESNGSEGVDDRGVAVSAEDVCVVDGNCGGKSD